MPDDDAPEVWDDGSTRFGSAGARGRLHDAIQAEAIEIDGQRAVVYGWGLIVEWIAPDGARWLSQLVANANGAPAPEWQGQGYFHHALHDWPAVTGPDEGDDE